MEVVTSGGFGVLTLLLGLGLHLQVHGGEAQLVGLLRGQVGRPPLLHGVAHAEAAPHGGHLAVELLPRDLVVEAQPAELDLHPEGRWEEEERRRRGVKGCLGNYTSPKMLHCNVELKLRANIEHI